MRNPIRRSKKIGITQGGRVKDGRPDEKWSRFLSGDIWQQLSQNTPDSQCRLLTENPSKRFYHPCQAKDYLSILNRLPAHLAQPVKAIVLRRIHKLDYKLGIEARMRFSCVILNAFPRSNEMTWPGKPTEATRRHYERWCSNWINQDDQKFILRWTDEEVKRYYLYHLFLHEVGHINQPWSIKQRQREEFAENFALEWASKLGKLHKNLKFKIECKAQNILAIF